MLHPTVLPKCEAELNAAGQFLVKLFKHACRNSPVTLTSLQGEFGNALGNWLYTGKCRSYIYDPLVVFSMQPVNDRTRVLADLLHDLRRYPAARGNPAFRFRLRGDNPGAATLAAKQLLVGTYKQFAASGFYTAITPGSTRDFNKDQWWNSGYLGANPRRIMCAVCDGTMKDGVTAEHYFPKSLYPALSVSRHNLLPLCKECNNVYKKDLDPLDGRSVTSIFLPYYRFVRDAVCIQFAVLPSGVEEATLRPITADPDVPNQLKSLSDLFGIPAQWNKNMHEVAAIAKRALTDYIEYLKDDGRTISDKAALVAAIDRTIGRMQKDWGSFHYYYPATEWLRWAKVNKLDSLFAELAARTP